MGRETAVRVTGLYPTPHRTWYCYLPLDPSVTCVCNRKGPSPLLCGRHMFVSWANYVRVSFPVQAIPDLGKVAFECKPDPRRVRFEPHLPTHAASRLLSLPLAICMRLKKISRVNLTPLFLLKQNNKAPSPPLSLQILLQGCLEHKDYLLLRNARRTLAPREAGSAAAAAPIPAPGPGRATANDSSAQDGVREGLFGYPGEPDFQHILARTRSAPEPSRLPQFDPSPLRQMQGAPSFAHRGMLPDPGRPCHPHTHSHRTKAAKATDSDAGGKGP
jgi:hypothetical protein